MSTRIALITVLLACPAWTAQAAELITAPALTPPLASQAKPADEAFALTTAVEADGDLMLVWEIQPAFYLYRKSLKLEHAGVDLLPALELPEAEQVTDEFFGESEVYFERLLARLPAAALNATAGTTLELQLTYQGCLEDIYCYPPQYKTVSVSLP